MRKVTGVEDRDPVTAHEHEETRTREWRDQSQPLAHRAEVAVGVAELLRR